MAKNDVLMVFETDLKDPGALKSGEYLAEHVLRHAHELVLSDRIGLVEVLDEWLKLRQEPQTMLAVAIVRELHVREMRDELTRLRVDIERGGVFLPFYLRYVDKALAAL